ncbi:MAG: hypothetical protein WAZ18_00030 [Alphaproteobacteria bacterium]
MKPLSLSHSCPHNLAFTHKAMDDFHTVVRFFNALPEPTFQPASVDKDYAGLGYKDEPVWTCHALARAAVWTRQLQLPWCVVDGHYGLPMKNKAYPPGYSHSWLEVRDTTYLTRYVLDVYPWATLSGPTLVDISGLSPQRHLYHAMEYPLEVRNTLQNEAREALLAWRKPTGTPSPLDAFEPEARL